MHFGPTSSTRLTSTSSTPLRRSDLHRPRRGADHAESDSDTEKESTDGELGNRVGRSRDDRSDADAKSAGENGLSTTVSVGHERSGEGADHLTAGGGSAKGLPIVNHSLHSVERGNDRDLGAFSTGLEGGLEMFHREDTGEERTVVPVCDGAQKGDENREVQMHRGFRPSLDLTLSQSILQRGLRDASDDPFGDGKKQRRLLTSRT
jgi:hypothetical protein